MILQDFRIALAEQTLCPAHTNFGPWYAAFQDHLRKDLSRLQRFVLNLSKLRHPEIRDRFATHLVGHGVEIGAQYKPTKVPEGATVEYVDVLSNEQLVTRYGLPAHDLVPLAHVIDGHNLSPYADRSVDFLIANHVLEHFDDPVSGIVEWLRILRGGGLLFLTLPNFRGNAFDYERQPERAAHFRSDYTDPANREVRNRTHYEDMAMSMLKRPRDAPEVQSLVSGWISQGDRNHYHVFDETAVRDVLSVAAQVSGDHLDLIDALLPKHGYELLVVIKKRASKQSSGQLKWLPKILNKSRAAKIFALAAIREIRRRVSFRVQTRKDNPKASD